MNDESKQPNQPNTKQSNGLADLPKSAVYQNRQARREQRRNDAASSTPSGHSSVENAGAAGDREGREGGASQAIAGATNTGTESNAARNNAGSAPPSQDSKESVRGDPGTGNGNHAPRGAAQGLHSRRSIPVVAATGNGSTIDLTMVEKSRRQTQDELGAVLGDLHVDGEGQYTPRSAAKAKAVVNAINKAEKKIINQPYDLTRREYDAQQNVNKNKHADKNLQKENKNEDKQKDKNKMSHNKMIEEKRCFECGMKGHKADECRLSSKNGSSSSDSDSSSTSSESTEDSSSEPEDPCHINPLKTHDQQYTEMPSFEDVDNFKFPWIDTFTTTFIAVEKVVFAISTLAYVGATLKNAIAASFDEKMAKIDNVSFLGDHFTNSGTAVAMSAVADVLDKSMPSKVKEGIDLTMAIKKMNDNLKWTTNMAKFVAINRARGIADPVSIINMFIVAPVICSVVITAHEYWFRAKVKYTYLRPIPRDVAVRDMRHTSQKARPGFYPDQQLHEYLVYDRPYGIHGYLWALLHDSLYKRSVVSGELFVAALDGRNTLDTLAADKMYAAIAWRCGMEDRIYMNRYDVATADIVHNTARLAYHYVMSMRRVHPRTF